MGLGLIGRDFYAVYLEIWRDLSAQNLCNLGYLIWDF